MYLLDTNVVSEIRRPRPHGAVVAWLASIEPDFLRIPAIVVGEIQRGAEHVREYDVAKAAEFDTWLTKLLRSFAVIAMDGDTMRIWAKFMVNKPDHLVGDAMIAATARQHGLTVATRNVRDFKQFPVPLINPFQPN